ncbi:permease for cytosine/purines, uracil, thiamine, allantoin-domain-containing protein [Aspergillus egyptiacus]|nr:permease for cytosine/purines, uracil, thiamine, allantoin-domain-containing protein [Aspergillus egyptiacus]
MGLRERLQVKQGDASLTVDGVSSNKDLDPIPLDSPKRTWGWPSLTGFWIAEAFSISMYQVTSSSVAKGLSAPMAIAAVVVGHILVCIPAMLDGYVGAIYGINFPVYTRASFGMRGSYFAVFIRGIVAIIWFGTQTYQAGQCVSTMLSAIWPSFKNFPNKLPAGGPITSSELLCFFLAILLQAPLLWLKVSKLRYFFIVKTCIMPIFGIILFAWAVHAANGFGPVFNKPSIIHDGTPVAVVFLQCATNAIGPKATLALNMPDFTRYATKPRDVFWTQAVGLVVLVSLCGVLGATVSSATEVIYGQQTWNPLEVAVLWENRAAQFFAAACWALAAMGTNISANSVSFSNDLALWFPRYVDTRRGAYICALLSILSMPWYIQNSAASFSAFLGGYSLFLGALAGVIVVDYWVCRRRRLRVRALYEAKGTHYFTKGFNVRAGVAFLCGITPNLPGLAAVTGQGGVPVGATYLYSLSWLVSTLVSGVVYWVLFLVWPFDVDEKVVSVLEGVDGVDRVEEGVVEEVKNEK